MHRLTCRYNRLHAILAKTCLWIISETLLAHLGLDDALDMGEWVFEREWDVGAQVVQIQ